MLDQIVIASCLAGHCCFINFIGADFMGRATDAADGTALHTTGYRWIDGPQMLYDAQSGWSQSLVDVQVKKGEKMLRR
ncbi:MAG: hypothetical protein IPP04_03250 [Saprospiraceae bacterium]|nr:hypothetical protein [Saprospiraceae bacterium]